MRAHSPVEDTIRTRVEEHPDEVWLKFRDETYTWAEVLSNIQRAANGLLELGVRPGERVAILMGNRPEFIWTHLGIVFIGALSVPVNTSQRGATLEHILADSDSVAMVFDELRDAVLAVKDRLPSLRRGWREGGRRGRLDDRAIAGPRGRRA
jgi:crotonobetaine/carnitine-CoA ligase